MNLRALACSRSEWWLQHYLWIDGVRLDKRCVFGSSHLVGFFERVTTFVLKVAARRIREFDKTHPYQAGRQEWQRWREERLGGEQPPRWSSIYLDDAFGLSALGKDEPMRGRAAGEPLVKLSFTTEPHGRVKLWSFVDMSRAEIHLAIVKATFEEAGWAVQASKLQLGESIEVLGLGVDTRGDGCLYVPETKRLGMRHEIAEQQAPQAKDGLVAREDVEGLVGRCGHVAQVICEAKPYMAPMYVMQNAKRLQRTATGSFKIKPARLAVKGGTENQLAYQGSLAFMDQMLEEEVTAPLAPRLEFPEIGDEGCGFLFTDAAREEGTGHGAFTVVTVHGHANPVFLHLERTWEEHVRQALMDNLFSMPAGECYGAVLFAHALALAFPNMSHVVVFTDSKATARALTCSSSGSPQLNYMVQWLHSVHPHLQVLGVWQPGKRNERADALSRGAAESVVQSAAAAGMTVISMPLPHVADVLLAEAMRRPLGSEALISA